PARVVQQGLEAGILVRGLEPLNQLVEGHIPTQIAPTFGILYPPGPQSMLDAIPSPLVSTDWLAVRLEQPDLVLLDASWYLAAAGRDGRAEYAAAHLPGALFWDLEALSDRRSPLPHMLPDP